MKTSFKPVFLAVLCAGGLVSLPTACTQAPLQRNSSEYDYDALINTAVSDQLVSGLGVRRESIKVETYRGAVTLSGFVSSEDQRERATQLAMSSRGVQSVKNDLTVLGSTESAPPPGPAPAPRP